MNHGGNGDGNSTYFMHGIGPLPQVNAQNATPPTYGSYNYDGGQRAPSQFIANGGPGPQGTPEGAPLPAGAFLQVSGHAPPGAAAHTSIGQQAPQGAPSTPAPTGSQAVGDETARGLAVFVDSLVNDSPIKFEDEQRKDLHEFATIGRNAAPTGQIMLELMNRTLMQQVVTMVKEIRNDMVGVKKEIASFQRAQDAKFELTLEHKNLIRAVAKKYLIEADRTNYTQIFKVVLDDLKARKVVLHLADIFAHDTKSKAFIKGASVVSGNARNHFRESIQFSVGVGKPEYEGLIRFATRMLGQFAASDTMETLKCEAAVVLKLAILRRFTLDNKDIVSNPDVEDEDPKDDGDNQRKRRKTEPQLKRGKVSTVNSYFGRLELFLKDKEKQFGTADITSKAWGPYLYKTMKQDYDDFPDPANEPEDLEAYAVKIFGAPTAPSVRIGGGSGLSNIASQFTAPM